MRLDSLNRLRHLAEIATSHNLLARDLAERARAVRDERRRVSDRIERLKVSDDYADRSGVDQEVARLRTRLADLDAAIADLDHRQAEASAAFQASKSLEARCRDFAIAHGLPTPEEIIADGHGGRPTPGGLGMVYQGGAA